jgi:hypothetical protein
MLKKYGVKANNNNNNNVTSVIIWANRTISKSFRQHLSNITAKHDTQELPKTAILGIVHILRKVGLLIKARNVYYGKQHYMYHIL